MAPSVRVSSAEEHQEGLRTILKASDPFKPFQIVIGSTKMLKQHFGGGV